MILRSQLIFLFREIGQCVFAFTRDDDGFLTNPNSDGIDNQPTNVGQYSQDGTDFLYQDRYLTIYLYMPQLEEMNI